MAVGGAVARTGSAGIGADFALKGGIALELRRFGMARATKDLDLTYRGSQVDMVLALEEALESPFGRFRFQRTGSRFKMERAEAIRVEIGIRFDGAEWGTLPIDLTRQETASETVELVAAFDIQRAFGIEGPGALPCLTLDYHLAHKLHAVTRPDTEEYINDRVQDLVDLLIFGPELMSPAIRPFIQLAAREVFRIRATHSWPPEFAPPARWSKPFARMAIELSLEPNELQKAAEEIGRQIRILGSS